MHVQKALPIELAFPSLNCTDQALGGQTVALFSDRISHGMCLYFQLSHPLAAAAAVM